MGIEHQFFIWEERNSTDQQTNLSKNVVNDNCGIITEIKKDLTKPDKIDTKSGGPSGIRTQTQRLKRRPLNWPVEVAALTN